MLTRNKEQAMRILAEAIAAQTGIDNAGDGSTILFVDKNPALNLSEVLDYWLAEMEIEVEWDDNNE